MKSLAIGVTLLVYSCDGAIILEENLKSVEECREKGSYIVRNYDDARTYSCRLPINSEKGT